MGDNAGGKLALFSWKVEISFDEVAVEIGLCESVNVEHLVKLAARHCAEVLDRDRSALLSEPTKASQASTEKLRPTAEDRPDPAGEWLVLKELEERDPVDLRVF